MNRPNNRIVSPLKTIISHLVVKSLIIKGYVDLHRMNRAEKKALDINTRLLFSILKRNRNCEFGKSHHFADIRTIEDFQRNVPLSNFHDYESFISRMEEGCDNVLTSSKVLSYSRTTGTVGHPKHIPMTQPEVNVYVRYTLTRALALADKRYRSTYHRHMPVGHLMTTIFAEPQVLPSGAISNNISDIGASQYGFLYPYMLTHPTRHLFALTDIDYRYVSARYGLADENVIYIFSAFMATAVTIAKYIQDNWEMLVNDIENGTIDSSVAVRPEIRALLEKKLKPMPERAAYLRSEFEKGIDSTLYKRIWPKLTLYSAIGTAVFAAYKKDMDRVAAGVWHDNLIYGASEGLFAAADALESDKLLLLADSCFYEFIPCSDDESDERTYLLNELEVGKEYEIVVTNQAGLYRYRNGDVVRVLGHKGQCPYVVFARRKGQLVSLNGEKTTEEQIQYVIELLEKEADCSIPNWAVCEDKSGEHSRYMLLIENNQNKDLSLYSDFVNDKIGIANNRYHELVGTVFDPAIVVNQKPGTHDEWRAFRIKNGASTSNFKPVHLLDNSTIREFFLSRKL